MVCGAGAIAMILVWMWNSDPRPTARDIGGGYQPADSMLRSALAFVVGDGHPTARGDGSPISPSCSRTLYLWTVSPQVWPNSDALPTPLWPMLSAALLAASAGAAVAALRALPTQRESRFGFVVLIACGVAALLAAFAVEVWAHWSVGLRPTTDAHAAMVAMAAFLQAQLALPVVIWACFVVARLFAGQVDRRRRATVENLTLMWVYVAVQGTVRVDPDSRLSEDRHVTAKTAPFSGFVLALAGPVVWAAHFFIVYGLEAAMCTRASSPAFIMRWIVAIATAIAIAALAAFVFRCFLKLSSEPESLSFLNTISIFLALISIGAILAVGASNFHLSACVEPTG